jgi:threonine synthase
MAFNLSAQAGKLVKSIGSYTELAVGMVTMVTGAATVTVPALHRLDGIVGCVQGATGVGETVICTATSGNTADLETVDESGDAAGTSVVMFIAWGIPKA